MDQEKVVKPQSLKRSSTIFYKDTKTDAKKKQLIFRLNAFDEINLQAQNNEMNIFCQNNTNTHKIVYIDKFEFFWRL